MLLSCIARLSGFPMLPLQAATQAGNEEARAMRAALQEEKETRLVEKEAVWPFACLQGMCSIGHGWGMY